MNSNFDKLRNIFGNNKNINIKNIQRNLLFDSDLAQKRLNIFLEITKLNKYVNNNEIKLNIIKEDTEDNIYIIDIIGINYFYAYITLNTFLKYKYLDSIDKKESINLVNINYSNIYYTYYFEKFKNYNIKYDKLIPKISKGDLLFVEYNNALYNNKSIYYCNELSFIDCNISNLNNIENIFNIDNINNIKYLTPELKKEYKDKVNKIYDYERKVIKQIKNKIYINNNKNRIIIPTFNVDENKKIDEIYIKDCLKFMIRNNKIKKLIISFDLYENMLIDINEFKKQLENITDTIDEVNIKYVDDIRFDLGIKYKILKTQGYYNLDYFNDLPEECIYVCLNIADSTMYKRIKKQLNDDETFNNFYNFLVNIRKNKLTIKFYIYKLFYDNIKYDFKTLIERLKNAKVYNNKIRIKFYEKQ